MDIGAINKGKGKGKHKGKGKKRNKGKGYGQQGYGHTTPGKGKGAVGQTVQYKGYSNYTQGQGKGQGKATGKGKGYTTGRYRCNQATWQKSRASVYNIQEDAFRKNTTMQLSSGMDHKPPMTTIGGQTTKHKSTQCSNHNNLHCQHLHH